LQEVRDGFLPVSIDTVARHRVKLEIIKLLGVDKELLLSVMSSSSGSVHGPHVDSDVAVNSQGDSEIDTDMGLDAGKEATPAQVSPRNDEHEAEIVVGTDDGPLDISTVPPTPDLSATTSTERHHVADIIPDPATEVIRDAEIDTDMEPADIIIDMDMEPEEEEEDIGIQSPLKSFRGSHANRYYEFDVAEHNYGDGYGVPSSYLNSESAFRATAASAAVEQAVMFLGGATEELLVSRIFPYFHAVELCRLAVCSKYFTRITSSPKLWNSLLKVDFLLEEDESSTKGVITGAGGGGAESNTFHHLFYSGYGHHNNPERINRNLASLSAAAASVPEFARSFQPSSASSSSASLPFYQPVGPTTSTTSTAAKAFYIRKYKDLHNRIEGKRDEKVLFNKSIQSHYRMTWVEYILDMTLVRVLIPLPLITIFASILMIGLYYDGVGVPMWVCAAPVLFLFVYFFVCMMVLFIVFHRRYVSGSVVLGVWNRLNCPLKTFYQDVFHESKKLLCFALFGVILALLQVLLIAVKLSVHVTPAAIRHHLEWGIVFLPLWLLMAMYCISPLVRFITDRALYFSILIALWIPLCIIAVCLVVKLDGEDHHNRHGHMRLALIFMPLWVYEGLFLTGSLISIVLFYHR
jgi:hypothetical protein